VGFEAPEKRGGVCHSPCGMMAFMDLGPMEHLCNPVVAVGSCFCGKPCGVADHFRWPGNTAKRVPPSPRAGFGSRPATFHAHRVMRHLVLRRVLFAVRGPRLAVSRAERTPAQKGTAPGTSRPPWALTLDSLGEGPAWAAAWGKPPPLRQWPPERPRLSKEGRVRARFWGTGWPTPKAVWAGRFSRSCDGIQRAKGGARSGLAGGVLVNRRTGNNQSGRVGGLEVVVGTTGAVPGSAVGRGNYAGVRGGRPET